MATAETQEITNHEDIIDSRDVIARIEWLEDDRAHTQETEGADAVSDWDDDYGSELADLKALAEQAEGYADDWEYGATLVRDSYFQDYAQELAEDIGAIPDNLAAKADLCLPCAKANHQTAGNQTDGSTRMIPPYTRGPWYRLSGPTADRVEIVNSVGPHWASPAHYVGEVSARNAPLVVSAPELLDALKGALEWLDNIKAEFDALDGVTGYEHFLDLMPNNSRGRTPMRELIELIESGQRQASNALDAREERNISATTGQNFRY